jgi:predicted P-loop ATPase
MKLLNVTVRYDSFHDRMLITGLEGHDTLNDAAVEKLWLLIDERYKLLPDKDFFFVVVKETARRNTFHPVRDYLDALRWDGVKRIDTWLSTYGRAKDTPYVRAVGRIMLVAGVRRVRKPGCKFDELPTFESPQGKLKCSALEVLAVDKDWFDDNLPLNADSKKVIEQTVGTWIIEVSDLSGMKKAQVEHLKAFLSRKRDRSRMAFGRLPVDKLREFIIVGTRNETVYLKDLTGNGRF